MFGNYLLMFESGSLVKIIDGTFNINSADDAIHSDGLILIGNDTFNLATADDGIHAYGPITVQDDNITLPRVLRGYREPRHSINWGIINITANDDRLNASKSTGGGRNDNTILTREHARAKN